MLTRETLYVGEQPDKLDPSQIVHITSREQTEQVPDGATIQRWDYVTVVNSKCRRPSNLQPLRHLSDDLADQVVDMLELKPGQDALSAIEAHLARSRDGKRDGGKRDCVDEFWQYVTQEPPSALGFSQINYKNYSSRGRPDEAMHRNDRSGKSSPLGQPCLEEGQAVFWRYAGSIFTALMHFSLAGGFGAPHLAATMKATAYLTSNSRDATYRRLLETTLFVLDAMTDMRVGEGKGWRSAVRVRLLHAQVRRKIRLGLGKQGKYDYEEHGIPINQADLATVLGAFMIAPLWSLQRTGISLTAFELSSYQTAWRYVGYYLGIDADLLEEFYGSTYADAESAFASLAFDAFPTESPSDPLSTPTYKILSAVSERPPRKQSIGHHLQYSRRLLGTGLANQLSISSNAAWKDRASVAFDLYCSYIFVTFGRLWPRKGWDRDRQAWVKKVIPLLVLWNLGERRTVFAWRPEQRREDKLGKDEGEDVVSDVTFARQAISMLTDVPNVS
ncbi:hypothetical protein OIO90_000694 [Microbotryomycetes sp. JL221]|nr:hypothetical protein OIO90_000694 [Microbotryomycetes sp. JL221]